MSTWPEERAWGTSLGRESGVQLEESIRGDPNNCQSQKVTIVWVSFTCKLVLDKLKVFIPQTTPQATSLNSHLPSSHSLCCFYRRLPCSDNFFQLPLYISTEGVNLIDPKMKMNTQATTAELSICLWIRGHPSFKCILCWALELVEWLCLMHISAPLKT